MLTRPANGVLEMSMHFENISPLSTTYYSLHDPRGFLYSLFPNATMWIPIINASQKRRNKQGGKYNSREEKRRKAESKNAYGSCRHFWWMVARKRLDELLVMLDYRPLSGKRVSAPPWKELQMNHVRENNMPIRNGFKEIFLLAFQSR